MKATEQTKKITNPKNESPKPEKKQSSGPAFCVDRIINKSKYTVYHAVSKSNSQQYALKVFPIKEANKLSSGYLHECRIADITHPNIIKIHDYQPAYQFLQGNGSVNASYVLMDYAFYGDFYDLISKVDFTKDEKLIRTYFH
mmetsp:Transcript_12898/g.11020  ORF Transcript_12898/g.11020 Transcript_12898/m.11020 type:complete len:142 (-) Transcript_12898:696-1121(-)|eukprot:CAMPEP_0114587010 /NCGR_PEP_ID=MMETSP0125-20121206/10089_1 /TAXON_ID=485358 ORGANISM="Aristerostoma sp., Strain ATCC 50986" /NCGR_SAMPLE_ID=MMETSP0125 /ASSEMBLY_ACC=CAM_ASM_000245 /LENGTH=141 /DNA_ID=CAMNT_0001782731 /DNA_START=260 /DNA_END=685 /DNA_ORIENTATION=+